MNDEASAPTNQVTTPNGQSVTSGGGEIRPNDQVITPAGQAADVTTTEAQEAHEEYLAETRQLVDKHVAALFETLEAAVSRATETAQRAGVTRDNHAITVTSGARTMTFTVESIADLPEGADRAQAFAAGQARCIVQRPDGSTTEWVLHRVGAGDASPAYVWMDAASGQEVSGDDLAALLQSVFGASDGS